jgi:hypothetical protein
LRGRIDAVERRGNGQIGWRSWRHWKASCTERFWGCRGGRRVARGRLGQHSTPKASRMPTNPSTSPREHLQDSRPNTHRG